MTYTCKRCSTQLVYGSLGARTYRCPNEACNQIYIAGFRGQPEPVDSPEQLAMLGISVPPAAGEAPDARPDGAARKAEPSREATSSARAKDVAKAEESPKAAVPGAAKKDAARAEASSKEAVPSVAAKDAAGAEDSPKEAVPSTRAKDTAGAAAIHATEVDVAEEFLNREIARVNREFSVAVAENETERMEKLADRLKWLVGKKSGNKPEGKKMGLFDKIKASVGGLGKTAPKPGVEESVDKNLFELETKLAVLAEKRKQEVDKLKALVEQAASLTPDSFEYRQVRSRAAVVKNQISLYESQMKAFHQTLIDNQRYLQLVENGKTMANLAELMPKSEEADILLEDLQVDVTEAADRQVLFADVLKKHTPVPQPLTESFAAEDEEFDLAVRREAEKKQALEKGAETTKETETTKEQETAKEENTVILA